MDDSSDDALSETDATHLVETGRREPLLYSRELARLDAGSYELGAALDDVLAEEVLEAVRRHAPITFSRNGDHFGLLARAVLYVSLIHEDCGLDPDRPSYFKCYVPDPFEDIDPGACLLEFSTRAELFFDTLCVCLQWFPTDDFSRLYRAPDHTPEFDNAILGRRFRETLTRLLAPKYSVATSGLILPTSVGGSAPMIETPAYRALYGADWPEVAKRISDAQREVEGGRFADAVTDVGAALEAGLGRVGCQGKTLGDRVKAAKGSVFNGTETPLGDAAEKIAYYVAAVRNSRSDAHVDSSASRTDAELVLRTALALLMWLADRHDADKG